MPLLDYFRDDPFKMHELTDAFNMVPPIPGRIGQMGIFEDSPISTEYASIERLGETIAILASQPRGTAGQKPKHDKRDIRPVRVPHFPHDDSIWAKDLMGVRRFGSENEFETVAAKVDEQLRKMRRNHDVTLEYLRAGAIQGVVRDGDQSFSIIEDFFDLFGLTRTAIDFPLSTSTTDIIPICMAVRRAVDAALGNDTYSGLWALAGDDFYDALSRHETVKTDFARYRDGVNLLLDPRLTESNQLGGGGAFQFVGQDYFEYGNIIWENYSRQVGGKELLPKDEAQIIVLGAPGIYKTAFAPADFEETVNTLGLPVYAKQKMKDFEKGVDIHTQSNPLPYPNRPMICVQCTMS